MKRIYIFIILFLCVFITVGCGKKETKYDMHLISFSYSYGNYKEGYTDISIIQNDDTASFILSGSSNKIGYIDKEISSIYLNKINDIIKEYEVIDWDGFNKYEDKDNDNEIIFSIHLGYDDGSNYSASGYLNYPKNFDEVHKELLKIFNEIKEQ